MKKVKIVSYIKNTLIFIKPVSALQIIRSITLTIILFGCYNISNASVSIDSVKTTISRCPNNGTITVFVSTTQTPVLYSILSGPETRPLQSDSLFQGLFPGAYVVAATNIVGERDTQTVIIKGSGYVEPDFTWTSQQPSCYRANDGIIIGKPDTTGRKPFFWELTNTTTGTVISQSSDTFNHLISGIYSMRLYDSCQNFVTRNISILNTDSASNEVLNAYAFKIGCDTMVFDILVSVSQTTFPSIIKLTTYFLNDSVVKFISILNSNSFLIKDTVPGLTYGDAFRFNIESANGCGQNIYSEQRKIPEFQFVLNWFGSQSLCEITLHAPLEIYRNFYPTREYYYLFPKDPLTLIVKDIDSNKIVQQTINSLDITPKVPGRNYLITVTDGCGQSYSFDTIWPPNPMLNPSVRTNLDWGCIDSTSQVIFIFKDLVGPMTIEILSGPKFLYSTKPGFAYFDSIQYPYVYHNYSTITEHYVKNLPVGTYQYRVTDTCGNIINDSFTVAYSDLAIYQQHPIRYWYKAQCLNENILYFQTNYGDHSYYNQLLVKNLSTNHLDYFKSLYYYRRDLLDSIAPVPAGTYQLLLESGLPVDKINVNIDSCIEIVDTIKIEEYQRPRTTSFSIIYCNGNRYAELHPDSTRGVPPYSYEVISGPKLYPLQASNIFDFIPIGDYVCRIVDTCGNSNIMNFGVDTLIFPPITKIGSSCIGGNVILFYQSSPFFTYYWTKPDGTVFIGDTMRINGVTYADTGLYQITRFVNINNCKDSFNTVYRLESNTEYSFDTSICEGQTFTLNNHTYTNSGTYADTILSASCDTIYTLHLIVLNKEIKNIDTTLCIGQRIQVGNHFYDQPGTYSDTLNASNGCDSIITLKITLVQMIDIAITASETIVAPGDTIQLNAISTQQLFYNWTSFALLNDTRIQNPTALINQPTWIYLDVVNPATGCKNSDSVFIDIFNNCDKENVFIPNSFTPNGDGVNDIFKVRSKILRTGNLMIYDRWGNKVFESNDLTKGWDGIYKGQPAPEDAYGYSFEGDCLNGEKIKLKGNVTLLR